MYLPTHVFFQYEHRLNLQLSIIDMGQSFRPPLQDIIAQDDASKHRPTRESHIDCLSRPTFVYFSLCPGVLILALSPLKVCLVKARKLW